MLDSLPLFYVGIFGLLMLLAHLAGAMMANWSFRDVARFQESLVADQERLRRENEAQREEIFRLRQDILELQQRLNVAEEQIAQYSLQLT